MQRKTIIRVSVKISIRYTVRSRRDRVRGSEGGEEERERHVFEIIVPRDSSTSRKSRDNNKERTLFFVLSCFYLSSITEHITR